MSIVAGRIYSVGSENKAIPGCTVSEEIFGNGETSVVCFCLDGKTNISAESYDYPKLMLLLTGKAEVFNLKGNRRELKADDCIIVPAGIPTGVDALRETISVSYYTSPSPRDGLLSRMPSSA